MEMKNIKRWTARRDRKIEKERRMERKNIKRWTARETEDRKRRRMERKNIKSGQRERER